MKTVEFNFLDVAADQRLRGSEGKSSGGLESCSLAHESEIVYTPL
jgi:hypothetical protein